MMGEKFYNVKKLIRHYIIFLLLIFFLWCWKTEVPVEFIVIIIFIIVSYGLFNFKDYKIEIFDDRIELSSLQRRKRIVYLNSLSRVEIEYNTSGGFFWNSTYIYLYLNNDMFYRYNLRHFEINKLIEYLKDKCNNRQISFREIHG